VSVQTGSRQAAQSSGPCHAAALIDHVTALAKDELNLDRMPNGAVLGDMTEFVESASSPSYAVKLHQEVLWPKFQACFGADAKPEYWPNVPMPSVRPTVTATRLPVAGAGPAAVAVRYHLCVALELW
jgi:hypothetical protein